MTCRIGFERQPDQEACTHRWENRILEAGTCLWGGKEELTCRLCGLRKVRSPAALGHLDADRDRLLSLIHIFLSLGISFGLRMERRAEQLKDKMCIRDSVRTLEKNVARDGALTAVRLLAQDIMEGNRPGEEMEPEKTEDVYKRQDLPYEPLGQDAAQAAGRQIRLLSLIHI